MANFGFDPGEYKDPQGGNFTPVPAGRYFVKGIVADGIDTSSGGEMIKARFEITQGDLKGRLIFQNFNVVNASAQAQTIARELLSSWARACGKPKAMDTDLLLHIEVQADVYVQPAKGQYGPSNQVRIFYPRDHKDEDAPAAGQVAPASNGVASSTKEAVAQADPARQGPAAGAKQPTSKPAAAPAKGTSKNPWDD